jgi:hypothetical protein
MVYSIFLYRQRIGNLEKNISADAGGRPLVSGRLLLAPGNWLAVQGFRGSPVESSWRRAAELHSTGQATFKDSEVA